MDPSLQPINGISLERYADLGAAISDCMEDAAKVAQIVQQEGVALPDWEAAKTGWTARMQDMSLMGRVAMAYMPLYQAALAKRKGGQAQASYEDFVAVSAAIKVFGFEGALNASGVTMADWTEVAGHWNQAMGREMHRFAGHPNAIAQEEGRLRGGGAPKRMQINRVAGQIPQAPNPAAGGNPYAAAMGVSPAQAQGMPAGGNPMQQAMAAAQANPAYQQAMQNQAAIAQNPLGFGLGQAANYLTGGLVAGTNVVVTWPNGQQYGGRILQMAPQQILVEFQGGSQQWVPEHAVRKA
jgi:hypothetical protein